MISIERATPLVVMTKNYARAILTRKRDLSVLGRNQMAFFDFYFVFPLQDNCFSRPLSTDGVLCSSSQQSPSRTHIGRLYCNYVQIDWTDGQIKHLFCPLPGK